MITLEFLTQQRMELNKQLDATIAQENAISGALQFCDALMAKLTKEGAEEIANQVSVTVPNEDPA